MSIRWHDTATIQNPGQVTNPHTGEVEGEPSWADDDRDDTPGVRCSIQPATSIEATATGAVLISGWVSFWPANTSALLHTSRISWRGHLLEVDGEVAPWVKDGAVHHLEAPLKEWSA